MKKFIILLVVFVASFFAFIAEAQEQNNEVNIGVQIRPRAEYRNGSHNPRAEDAKAANFTSQRSRLSVDYKNDFLATNITVQNVAVWGQNPHLNSTPVSATVLSEAWAQLKLDNNLFVKFGRQGVQYNDSRIMSIIDWNQHALYHDGVKLFYNDKSHQAELFLASNNAGERIIGQPPYAGGMPYKNMQSLYYQYNDIENFTPSFLFINLGYQKPNATELDVAYMQTIGTNLIYNPISELRLQGTAYYQMGKTTADKNISASLLALRADYTVNKEVKLFTGIDYVSGQDYGLANPSKNHTAFNTLFAANHAHYGQMDYFMATAYLNGWALGVNDKFLGINYAPAPKYSLMGTLHFFSMAGNVYKAGDDKINKYMGSELDLQFNYNIRKDVALVCGYSTFFGTESMDIVKGGSHKAWQDWAFLSVSVSPRVFSSKW